MSVKSGGCRCGSLKYTVEGEPINSLFCYCKECQMLTGSDKWFGVWVPKDNFKIVSGSPVTFTRKGDSGKDMNYLFCEKCGVTIGAEVTVGNFYSVSATTFNNPNDFVPAMAIYTASAPKWAVFPEGVPKFQILPPNLSA